MMRINPLSVANTLSVPRFSAAAKPPGNQKQVETGFSPSQTRQRHLEKYQALLSWLSGGYIRELQPHYPGLANIKEAVPFNCTGRGLAMLSSMCTTASIFRPLAGALLLPLTPAMVFCESAEGEAICQKFFAPTTNMFKGRATRMGRFTRKLTKTYRLDEKQAAAFVRLLKDLKLVDRIPQNSVQWEKDELIFITPLGRSLLAHFKQAPENQKQGNQNWVFKKNPGKPLVWPSQEQLAEFFPDAAPLPSSAALNPAQTLPVTVSKSVDARQFETLVTWLAQPLTLTPDDLARLPARMRDVDFSTYKAPSYGDILAHVRVTKAEKCVEPVLLITLLAPVAFSLGAIMDVVGLLGRPFERQSKKPLAAVTRSVFKDLKTMLGMKGVSQEGVEKVVQWHLAQSGIKEIYMARAFQVMETMVVNGLLEKHAYHLSNLVDKHRGEEMKTYALTPLGEEVLKAYLSRKKEAARRA